MGLVVAKLASNDTDLTRSLYSIAVFLHTLRFKKIVHPNISFGIYVTMAYMSFLAVPPLLMNLLAR